MQGGWLCFIKNHLRYITVNLIHQVCHDVRIEPPLQTLIGETFDNSSTNVKDEARLQISVRRFWTKYQMVFFDVRVFDPNAMRYQGKSLQQCYMTNEVEKKRKYDQRILQVKNESFTQLVFPINGRMGKEANKCYSRIAKK